MAEQIDIDNLVYQMRELIPTLKDLSSTRTTSGSNSDRGSDKIVMAIAKLSAKLNENTKTKTKENVEIAKFTKEIDEATDATKKLTEQQEAAVKQQKEAADNKKKQDAELAEAQKRAAMSADELAKYNKELAFGAQVTAANDRRKNQSSQKEIKSASDLVNEYSRGVTGTAALREKFDSLGGTSVAANMGFRLLSVSTEAFAKSLVEYSKSIYQGKQGAAVAAKSVNTFAQAVGTAAQVLGGIVALIPGFQALGIGALVAGTGLKAVGNYAETAAEMSDRLFNTYQDLSKVGASSADGMRGLGESAVRLGYGLDDVGLKAFSDLISKSSTDLALLSGTVIQGRKDFVKLGEGITRGPVGRSLMNMGMSVESINEGLVSYVALQARVGRTQNKTTAQLQVGAAAYLKEMDGLTKLTGIQRSEMEQSINKARSVEQFRAKTEAMRASGDERQAAAADEMERYYAVLSKQAPELAQGYAESASGLITSPAGVKFFQTIGSATGVVEGLSSGVMNATQAYDASNKAGKQFATQFNSLGQAGVIASSGFGNFVEAANLGARANQDLTKSAREIEEAQKGQKAGADGVVSAQVDLRREQMNTRDNLQKLVELGVKPTTKAMQGFAEFVESITGIPKKVAPGTSPAGAPMTTGPTAPSAGPRAPGAQSTTPGAGAQQSSSGAVPIGTPVAPKPAVAVAAAGPGFTTVNTADGDKQQRKGARNWRNNNPGNIEHGRFSASMGAIGTDGRFAVFPTLEMGTRAKEELLFGARSKYAGLSISDALNRYAPPNENDTAAYIDSVTRAIGVSPDTKLNLLNSSQRQAMLASISKVEGFRPGEVLQAATGGIVSARRGGTKLIAGEAGMNEAFVPLPDGKTIPVTVNFAEVLSKSGSGFADIVQQLQSTVSSQTNVEAITQAFRGVLADVMQQRSPGANINDSQLVELMSEMVRLQGANNSTAQRLLQVSTA
jgi:hypothetical protein